jgi:choline dehydrogenase-like flavoprotein
VSVGDRLESIGAHEVVLCAGAIETPHILMLSGLGPASELTKLGIDVIEDLPGVGKNLGDHPVAILEYEPGELDSSDEHRPGTAPPRCGIVHTAEGSPMRNDLLILPVDAAHFRTPPSFGTDEGGDRPPAGPDARVRIHCMLQLPLSRGWLELPSSCPTDAPTLHFNYFSDPLDLRRLRDGVRMAVEILEQPMSDGMVGARVTPTGIDLASDRSLDEWLLRTFNTCYHSCGTAKMGAEDDPSAVVDEQARVRGVEGLRVADLSIAPHVSRGTTNPTAVMIGERVAKLMATQSS